MAYCIYCGARLEKDARFCIQCGKPTTEPAPETAAQAKEEPCCSYCGARIEKADRFCTQCGHLLTPQQEEPAPVLDFMASDTAGEMELGGWEEVLEEEEKKKRKK